MIPCKTLIPLQELDLKIDAAKDQIEEKKQKIVRMQKDIEADAQLIEKKHALLKKIQLRKRKDESEFNELSQLIKNSEAKMQGAGLAPASYAALDKELANMRKKAGEAETRILEDMEKIEILEKDTVKGAKVIAGRKEHLEQIKVRVTDEVLAIKKEIELIQTQRSQASLKIETDILEKYEELRHRKRGQVIYAIENPSCPACGMGLPAGFVSSLATHEDAERCSNCEMLLYWTGLRD